MVLGSWFCSDCVDERDKPAWAWTEDHKVMSTNGSSKDGKTILASGELEDSNQGERNGATTMGIILEAGLGDSLTP